MDFPVQILICLRGLLKNLYPSSEGIRKMTKKIKQNLSLYSWFYAGNKVKVKSLLTKAQESSQKIQALSNFRSTILSQKQSKTPKWNP